GQDLDLLIEATDYLDSIGESGIMEGKERQSSKEIPSIEYLEKNAGEIAKRSPIEIPGNATYDIQEKNGYNLHNNHPFYPFFIITQIQIFSSR
ncbi:MAG: hypothetical protein Q4G23_10160, partial [Clostridia bacterium]|nr:hypothetical protein [Clostridia bacterium]